MEQVEKMKLPTITVILPAHNEEEKIDGCLKSIRTQDYPQSKIEILIIDDDSTDETVKRAKNFGVKIIRCGRHDCQASRAMGLKRARGELVLILDADNVLVSRQWLKKSVQAFLENPDLVGSQPAWYEYNRKDFIVNRYCALFGVTQPVPFYLKKRSFMMTTEKKWIYPETQIKETKNYFLTRFNLRNLPTMGCQGFLVRRNLVLKSTYEPMFFHMDAVYEMVERGDNLFAFMKLSIGHQYVSSLTDFYRKMNKYMTNFLRFREVRRYTYEVGNLRRLGALLSMMSVVIPLIESIRGIIKLRDWAWFLHPLFCFTTPLMGIYVVLSWQFKKRW